MNRDAKKLDSLTARESAFVNTCRDYFTNRADTLKNRTENFGQQVGPVLGTSTT